MAKFNIHSAKVGMTENYAGGQAFTESPELEFISILLTSFVEDQYYKSAEKTLQRVVDLVNTCSPEFVAKAAVFARTEFGMRSISHAVAAELAKNISGKDWAKRFYNRIVHRPDDMLEILAYFRAKNSGKLANAMKNGFSAAFSKFDSYQLAKYRGEKRDIKLVDLVNLVHPVPSDKNREALAQLIKGELKSTETWESKLSKAGQNAETETEVSENKRMAWKELIISKKIGYFALLRNLRNIAESCYFLSENEIEFNKAVAEVDLEIEKKDAEMKDIENIISDFQKSFKYSEADIFVIKSRIFELSKKLKDNSLSSLGNLQIALLPLAQINDIYVNTDVIEKEISDLKQQILIINEFINEQNNSLSEIFTKKTILQNKINILIESKKTLFYKFADFDNELLVETCNLLENRKLIKNSLVLPFRFTTAIGEIEKISNIGKTKLLDSLNNALDISCDNVPEFSGKTLVVSDFSGSMGYGISSHKGKACLLGSLLAKKNNADFMIFGDKAKYVTFNNSAQTMEIFSYLHKQNTSEGFVQVGHGTNFHSIFTTANRSYDRIIILSDMQGWIGYNSPVKVFNEYKKRFDCNPFIYSLDLAGYGSLQFPEKKTFCMAGFSEKIFDIMQVLEQDPNALLHKIENVEI